jgi:hypothetical protein
MSVVKEVNITIAGQVPDDYSDNAYDVLLAKIKVIATEYRLEVVEA